MLQTQVLTYGIAGVLAERLRELAQAQVDVPTVGPPPPSIAAPVPLK